MKVQRKLLTMMIAVLIMTFLSSLGWANDKEEDLRAQIELLQQRITELEKTLEERNENPDRFHKRIAPRSWDPFEELHIMQRQMDQSFKDAYRSWQGKDIGMFSSHMTIDAKVDMRETSTGYEITVDLTGIDQDNLDIDIRNDVITIKGQSAVEHQEQGTNRLFSSKSYGSFMKVIPVPKDADISKVKTERLDYHLIIRLPKKQ